MDSFLIVLLIMLLILISVVHPRVCPVTPPLGFGLSLVSILSHTAIP
jgi:hypothetical protein